MEKFKEMQREIWDAGAFPEIARRMTEVGERVVAKAGVGPGIRVLDVACGTGNAARPAARTGAKVTGLDLVPSLLEEGRRSAEAEGLAVEWVEGDAEQLPFADDSFDRVLSTFGLMFATRHQRAADEMVRVCAPGGRIVFATWDPQGTVGEILSAAAPYAPPPPDFAGLPIEWGSEDHVREMFGAAREISFDRAVSTIKADSPQAFLDFFFASFGPFVMAGKFLPPEQFEQLRGEVLRIYERRNEASDGTLTLPQHYLISKIEL